MLAPAKINLGLQVHHRRKPDGYHYLSSIFVPIDFGDGIEIEPAEQDQLETENHLSGPAAASFEQVSERGDLQSNLVWRVLDWTRPARRTAVRVRLIKRVPTGAGLGGGSSDAGTLLRLLAESGLWNDSAAELANLALRAGADVPFFLHPEPALVTGIGERRRPVQLGTAFGLLALSDLQIATAMAYSALKRDLQGDPPPETLSGFSKSVEQALGRSDWKAARILVNDFEEPVFKMHPILARVKEHFYRNGADYAALSGSGAVVYALFANSEARDVAQDFLRAPLAREGVQLEPFAFWIPRGPGPSERQLFETPGI